MSHIKYIYQSCYPLLMQYISGAGQSSQASRPIVGIDACSGGKLFGCDNSSISYRVANPNVCSMYFNCTLGVLYPASCPDGQTFDRILYDCISNLPRCLRACPSSRADYLNYIFTIPAPMTTGNIVMSQTPMSMTTARVTAATTASQSDAGNSLTTVISANISVGDVTDAPSPLTYATGNVAMTGTTSATLTASSPRDGEVTTSQNMTSNVTSADYAASWLSAFESSQQQSTNSLTKVAVRSSTVTASYTQQSSLSVVNGGGPTTNSKDVSRAGPTSSFDISTSSNTDSTVVRKSSTSRNYDEGTHVTDLFSSVSVPSSKSFNAELITLSSSTTQAPSTESMQSKTSFWTSDVIVTSATHQLPQDERTKNNQVTSIFTSSSQPRSRGNDTSTITTTSAFKTTDVSTTTAQQATTVLPTDMVHNITGSVKMLVPSTPYISSTGTKPNTNRASLLTTGLDQPLTNVTHFTTVTRINTGPYAEYSIVPSTATATSVTKPTSSTGNEGVSQNATRSDAKGTSERPLMTRSYVTTSTANVTPANTTSSQPFTTGAVPTGQQGIFL